MTIDHSALQNLQNAIGSDPKDLVDIVESFLEEGPELLSALGAAQVTNDRKEMLRNAHSLKSNARDFGAVDLARMCEDLESHLRAEPDGRDLAVQVEQIRKTWPAIEAFLRQAIAKLP